MARVLVLTSDTIAVAMAGPAMRAVAITQACSSAGNVTTLATTGSVEEGRDAIHDAIHVDGDQAQCLAAEHDVVILQGHVLRARLDDLPSSTRLVVDAYDPFHFEQLASSRLIEPVRRSELLAETGRSIDEQLGRADFVLCAGEEQRALWLGHLAAIGRINTATFDADPTLRSLIDVAGAGADQDQLASAISEAHVAGAITLRRLRERAEQVDVRAALRIEQALGKVNS